MLMRRRHLAVLLLAVLVGLAGCGGGGASRPGANETATTTVDVNEVEYPDGYGRNGITNRAVALRTHNESLQDTGLRVQYAYSDGTNRTNITYTSSVRNRSVLVTCTAACVDGAETSTIKLYIADGRLYQLVRADGRTLRRTNVESDRRHETLHNVTATAGLRRFLPETTATDVTVVERNGTRHLRYTYNNSTLVVQENGMIETLEREGDAFHVRVYVRPSPGLTTQTPAWADRIPRQENDFDGGGSYSSGDTASDGCGTNDGDQSYDEDNDRDNDGLCDES